MTVLQIETAALAGMSENFWLEKACAHLIPALPLWIIEYAWTKRMMEVLEVLGPPLWLEGDWHLLTLEEPCRIRVVAAEVWRIMQTRDIKHFERVTEFLDVTYTLVPRLVTPIKHMKIMFGLQTLVIMWMLWNDRSTDQISEKIENFFPRSLPEYHKCSRRNMDLMQKNQKDFKSFAHVLTRDRDVRETYIRDLLEEQYGERYAQKLEERLAHYLGELDKVLPQPSCIEQVLKSRSYGKGEKILKKLLSRDSASVATILKRLLHCAVATNQSLADSLSPSLLNPCEVQREAEVVKPSSGTLCVFLRPSQNTTKKDRLSQTSTKGSQGLWQNRNTETILPQEKICDDRVIVTSTQLSDSDIDQSDFSQSLLVGRHRQEKTQSEPEQKESEPVFPEQICSWHGKKMRSILQECSEELEGEAIQAECTPTSTQSTPPLLPYTSQPQGSPNQHSLSSNADSSSTNISLSCIQQASLSPVSSTNPDALSPSVLQQPCSSQSAASKQLAVNAGQFFATAVFAEPSRTDKHILKLSLESQSFLMQSKWLQPQVCLNRLSKEECARAMDSYRTCDILERELEPEDDQYMLFDVNALYSDSYSEDSDSDSDDPDYKPD
ncbi:uncharacterized protein LOC122362508 [Puntigrus tetrazona]|uniref:uncharacterized protein LOC122362508 n=1 Tax=Puntigrus tetrazona TaxID=1606681 RepID=UPI001C8AA6E6|nr:uncharacterized protein LOC122362508 [Puntigrus tetrazona]